jgi:hypothetical protein
VCSHHGRRKFRTRCRFSYRSADAFVRVFLFFLCFCLFLVFRFFDFFSFFLFCFSCGRRSSVVNQANASAPPVWPTPTPFGSPFFRGRRPFWHRHFFSRRALRCARPRAATSFAYAPRRVARQHDHLRCSPSLTRCLARRASSQQPLSFCAPNQRQKPAAASPPVLDECSVALGI